MELAPESVIAIIAETGAKSLSDSDVVPHPPSSATYLDSLGISSTWWNNAPTPIEEAVELSEGTVVRLRVLVQDNGKQELFVGSWKLSDKSWKSQKYLDRAPSDISGDPFTNSVEAERVKLRERSCLQCVEVPGAQHWSSAVTEDQFARIQARSPSKGPSADRGLHLFDILVYPAEGECGDLNTNIDTSLPLVNDVVDIIGVVGGTRVEESLEDSDLPESPTEGGNKRVHVIALRRETRKRPIPSPVMSMNITDKLIPLKERVVQRLSSALEGDCVSAEFLLMALCASGIEGMDPNMGRIKLNLIGAPSSREGAAFETPRSLTPFASQLEQCLDALVSRVVAVPVSLNTLNNLRWIPRKNLESDRLEPGVLQLAPNTVLLLDETPLNAGKLTSDGTRNALALSTLVRTSTVAYDFGVYTLPFTADIFLVALSHKRSSLKPGFYEVVLCGKEDGGRWLGANESAESTWEMRALIDQVRYNWKPLDIPPKLQDIVAQSFVDARQEDPSVSSNLISSWMALARSAALLHGESSLTSARWEWLMALESERRERLKCFDARPRGA